MDLRDLETLIKIDQEGGFEKAARSLGVTASAVSQRIARLEDELGRQLVVRGFPAQLTRDGECLLRAARQVDLVLEEARREIHDLHPSGPLAVAVNHDSLATWFMNAVREFDRIDGRSLEIICEDQEATASLLAKGRVVAAVSSSRAFVPGCEIARLGHLRYILVASPEVAEASRSAGRLILFDRNDTPSQLVAAQHQGSLRLDTGHHLPDIHAMRSAALAGMGWVAMPETFAADDMAAGRLVQSPHAEGTHVNLYLHTWRTGSASLNRLAQVVRAAARSALAQG